MSKEVEIKIINATELKPEAKYIIAVERHQFSYEELGKLMKALKLVGIKNAVGMLTEGDPNTAVQIIEQES